MIGQTGKVGFNGDLDLILADFDSGAFSDEIDTGVIDPVRFGDGREGWAGLAASIRNVISEDFKAAVVSLRNQHRKLASVFDETAEETKLRRAGTGGARGDIPGIHVRAKTEASSCGKHRDSCGTRFHLLATEAQAEALRVARFLRAAREGDCEDGRERKTYQHSEDLD